MIKPIKSSSHLKSVSKKLPVKLAKSDLTEQLADLLALSILYTYNVIKTPTDCFFFFYSTGQTLCEWPAGLTLSFTFHTCEE